MTFHLKSIIPGRLLMRSDPPSKTAKSPLVLTPKDEEILRAIYEYRFVTALDIAHLLYAKGSLTYARSCLSQLAGGQDYADRQYLFRFPLPTGKAGSRERIYTLGAAGRDWLASIGLPINWYFRPSKTERLSRTHLMHNLTLTRFVIAAQYWCRTHQICTLTDTRLSYALASAIASENTGASTTLPIPDAWLLFERAEDGKRFPILLEIDRGFEGQTAFKNHVRARIEFIRSGDYARMVGTPAVLICYATTSQIEAYRDTRRKTMQTWTMEVLREQKRENWAGVFRFSSFAFERLYELALLSEALWYRPEEPSPVSLLTQ